MSGAIPPKARYARSGELSIACQELTLEQRIDDIGAVTDAAGVERATVLGISEGAAMGALFAAPYPARVDSLIM